MIAPALPLQYVYASQLPEGLGTRDLWFAPQAIRTPLLRSQSQRSGQSLPGLVAEQPRNDSFGASADFRLVFRLDVTNEFATLHQSGKLIRHISGSVLASSPRVSTIAQRLRFRATPERTFAKSNCSSDRTH